MALARSRLGVDHRGTWTGVIVEFIGSMFYVVWDDTPELVDMWDAREARYELDRGLMRFTPPPKKRRFKTASDDLVCAVCGARGKARKKCPPDHKGPGALKPEFWGEEGSNPALTPSPRFDKMCLSTDEGEMPPTEETMTMATTEKLSAKAAAIEIGTDARTLRKFLRSDASTFEPCGQGNRYEFSKGQLKKLTKEFTAWGGGKAKPKNDPIVPDPEMDEVEGDLDLIEDDDIVEDDDVEDDELEEPTDDDIIEMLEDEDLDIVEDDEL